MYQAIETKYLGPTNHRGARIAATTESGIRVVLNWDHSMSPQDNHTAAARAVAEAREWNGEWCGGSTKAGYVFVRRIDDMCEAFTV